MSAPRNRRAQPIGQGERAVLISRRRAEESEEMSTARALDAISRCGYELIAILDPDDYMQAHGMIADGLAEVIVVARFEHLPSVQMVPAGDPRRTQPVLRSWSETTRAPQVVQRGTASVELLPDGRVNPKQRRAQVIPRDQ